MTKKQYHEIIILRERYQHSRKNFNCHSCKELIKKGQLYKAVSLTHCGEFKYIKQHFNSCPKPFSFLKWLITYKNKLMLYFQ